MIKTDLYTGYGNTIFYHEKYLEEQEMDLLKFLDGLDYFKTLDFAQYIMMPEEIKANNNIEGISDDLSVIDKVIENKEKSPRIKNLYNGYRYILTHRQIDKESVKELYAILSKDLLDEYAIENMGDYYRNKPVYIDNRLDKDDPIEGMDKDLVPNAMNKLFEYINEDNTKTEMDIFIKSQVMHFYFVFIHPYFDVNGRTSRTISMWHLLNNKVYPYIILNRAINYSKRKYEDAIITSSNRGDVTLFLKYMLVQVLKALEKEYVVDNIKNNVGLLSKEEAQVLEYFISLNGTLTIKDLVTIYNHYNVKKRPIELTTDYIDDLIEQGIILDLGPTKKHITKDRYNSHIALNPDVVTVQKEKLKYLKIDRYMTLPK